MVMDVLDFDNHRRGFDFRFAKMSHNPKIVVLVVFFAVCVLCVFVLFSYECAKSQF